MTTLKEQMNAQWKAKGVLNSGHGNAWEMRGEYIHARAGTERKYKSKEQRAYEARFGIYNKKLVPIILAEATQTTGDDGRPHYNWPAHDKQADAKADAAVASVPRKRVSHKKVAQAAAILERVPADELTAFLARFGLSLSLAASIASLDNVEQIARQFLRATL